MPDYDKTVIVNLQEGADYHEAIKRLSPDDSKKMEECGPLLQGLTIESRLYLLGHGDVPIVMPAEPHPFTAKFKSLAEGTVISWKVVATEMAGYSPQDLAEQLYKKGLRQCKVIYLVCCNAGRGENSFAARFAGSIRGFDGVKVGEVRAPKGYVRVRSDGSKGVRDSGWFKKVEGELKFVSSNETTELDKKGHKQRL